MQLRAIHGEYGDTNCGGDFTMGTSVHVCLNGMIRCVFLCDKGRGLVDDFDSKVVIVPPGKTQPYHLMELVEAD